MPRLSPQDQATYPQNNVPGPEETAPQTTGAMQQTLLCSSDSGMNVFSSSDRILHMNGPARALMALFGTPHEFWPQLAHESMPSILTELCYDVLAQLKRRIEAQDWAQFELRHICHMVSPSLLLTGFGVLNSANGEIRVILTLTPCPSFHMQPRIHGISAHRPTHMLPLVAQFHNGIAF